MALIEAGFVIKEPEVTTTEPVYAIGPLPLESRRADLGHFAVQVALLSVAGNRSLDVTLRVSAFDE
jgi:hypothetical protein